VSVAAAARRAALACAVLGALAACGEPARWPVSAGTGAQPQLPAPSTSLLPTVHIAPARGRPSGMPLDVLDGFLTPDGDASGRPVGVAIDRQGALLVADDVGNVVWRVTAAH